MSTINSAEYVELKQAIYREYSRSYDEDRQRSSPLNRCFGASSGPWSP